MYHTAMPNHVAANLRRERKRCGLKQAELAELALGGAKNQAQLSRYEQGHNVPSLETLERLAQALSLSAADLIHDANRKQEAI